MNKKIICIIMLQLILCMPISFALSITNIETSEIGLDYAKITWQTDNLSSSEVKYGTNKSISLGKVESAATKNHSLLLSGLNNGTTYYYAVSSISGTDSVVDNNNGNFYEFKTPLTDTTVPTLDFKLPRYVTTEAINIFGETEPLAEITLYINDVKTNIGDADSSGKFSFLNKPISRFVDINLIKIEAKDKGGNVETLQKEVTVDVTKPEILIKYIPTLVNKTTLALRGNISEVSTLKILLNEKSEKEEETNVISADLQLNEGANTLAIRTEDKAGNKDAKDYTIIAITTPPVLSEISPKTGSFFYEGGAKTTLTGKASPGALVGVYIGREPDNKPDYATQANANGDFTIFDFNLEKLDAFQRCKKKCEIPQNQNSEALQSCIDTCQKAELAGQKEETIRVSVEAIGPTKLRSTQQLSYKLGNCYSGGMNWNIINQVEYQEPRMLSPERLEMGADYIQFYLKLDYQGYGTEAKITDVKIEPLCKGRDADPKYEYACKVIGTGKPKIRKSNSDKTMWRFRYDLRKLDGINKIPDDVFKELSKDFRFPFRVTVKGEHTVGKKEDTVQTKCIDVTYAVDTSRIDPRKVLPDWLLEDGADALNKTIQKLDKALEVTATMIKYAQAACMAGFVIRLIATISRRVQENAARFTGAATGGVTTCPKPGKSTPTKAQRKEHGLSATGSIPREKIPETLKLQGDLTNSELQTRCALVAGAWQREAKAYIAYRWACDRLLCSGSPAKWTEKADEAAIRKQIGKEIVNTKTYASEETLLTKTRCYNLVGVSKDIRGINTGAQNCFMYNGVRYYYAPTSDQEYTRTEDNRIIYNLVWTPVNPGKDKEPVGKTKIQAIQSKTKSGELALYTKREDSKDPSIQCTNACKTDGWKISEASNEIQGARCVPVANINNDVYTPTNFMDGTNSDGVSFKDEVINQPHTILRKRGLCEEDELCFCYQPKTDKQSKRTPPDNGAFTGETKIENNEVKWNYRYDKLGYYFDKYKYFEDRDKMACFGGNSWSNRRQSYINPKSFIGAFQCVCITQIHSRLKQLKTILTQLHSCLRQIKKTGEFDAGICKQLFTQYLCKWLFTLLTPLMKGNSPWLGAGSSGTGARLGGGMSAIFGGLSETLGSAQKDYSSLGARGLINIHEGNVAEKVCMGALTGDWGINFEGIGDAMYEQPFHTSVMVFPSEREYLSFSADTQESTYQYRLAYMISPGCRIDNWQVSLTCISDTEQASANIKCPSSAPDAPPGGCDCLSAAGSKLGAVGKREIIDQGARVGQSDLIDKDKLKAIELPYRYDHVQVRLSVNDPVIARDCIPPENMLNPSTGVWYFPIQDKTVGDIAACRFDQSTGTFLCDTGGPIWEKSGQSWFGDISCDPASKCEEIQYHLGDPLELDAEIFVQGPEQCLYVETKNGKGQVLHHYFAENVKGFEDKPNERVKIHFGEGGREKLELLQNRENIKVSHFGENYHDLRVQTDIGTLRLEHRPQGTDGDSPTITPGVYYVYVKYKDKGEIDSVCTSADKTQCPYYYTYEPGRTFLNIGGMNALVISAQRTGGEAVNNNPDEKRYTVSVHEPINVNLDQTWTISLELRRKTDSQSCEETTKADIIKYQNELQQWSKKIKVRKQKETETTKCSKTGANTKSCDCGMESEEQQKKYFIEPVTEEQIKAGRAPDCDGRTLQYCYKETGATPVQDYCHAYPVCGTAKNEKACDCNVDGKYDEKTEKECINGYCVDKVCTDKKPEPTTVIGGVTYEQVANKLNFANYQLCGPQYKPKVDNVGPAYQLTTYHITTRKEGQQWSTVPKKYIGDRGENKQIKINDCYPERTRWCLTKEYFEKELPNDYEYKTDYKKQFCVVQDKGFFEDVMCQGSGVDLKKNLQYSYTTISPSDEDENGKSTTMETLLQSSHFKRQADGETQKFYLPRATIAMHKDTADTATGNLHGIKRGSIVYIERQGTTDTSWNCCYRVTDVGGGLEKQQFDVFRGLDVWPKPQGNGLGTVYIGCNYNADTKPVASTTNI